MEKKKRIDMKAVDDCSHEVAKAIILCLMRSGLSSMKESHIALITGICRVIETTSIITDIDPKVMAEFYREAIDMYFKKDGDSTLHHIYETMKKGMN